VQIHLQQNRTDLAAKEAQRARKWAQDSLLVNIAESWVGMREVRLLISHLVCLAPANTPLGRREIPIRILRLRRTGYNLPIYLPSLPRRTSRLGTTPWPTARSRSRPPTSHLRRPQLRRHDRKPHRP
jgi:hypothetical protein